MVAHRILDQPRGLRAGEPVLGLALERRFADEHAQHDLCSRDHVLGADLLGLAVVHQLGKGAQALGQCRAQALLMRAAIGRGHGVAVPAGCPVGPQRPGHRPFDPPLRLPVLSGKILAAREELGGHAFAPRHLLGQMIGQPAGELEYRLLRHAITG